MVRYSRPLPEGGACSEDSRFRSSICQPKDNLGISCMFSAGNGTRDIPSTGVRRKYAAPKDNLGVACLPTTEYMRLRDIPEVSEHDSSEEIYEDNTLPLHKQKLRSKPTKITGRARCIAPKDNLSSSGRHVNDATIARVRLRAGEDGGQATRDKVQSRSVTCGGSNVERVIPLRPKGNTDFCGNPAVGKSFTQLSEVNVPAIPRIIVIVSEERYIQPNKSMQFRSTSLDIGISNIRRPKHDPRKPRKPIVPKDNIGFSGCHLQKSLIRSSGRKTPASFNVIKISRESEKKHSSPKSVSNFSEKLTGAENNSLRSNNYKPK